MPLRARTAALELSPALLVSISIPTKRTAAFCLCALSLLVACVCRLGRSAEVRLSANSAEDNNFFYQKVYPLLESKCFGCHGEEKDREGAFDMRTREGLLKGGESGKPALVPGNPEKSPIYRAVLRTEKLKMPPKERNRLSEQEVALLRQWIETGAPWPSPIHCRQQCQRFD